MLACDIIELTALEHSVKREIKRSLIVVLTGPGQDQFDESKYK